ncbi:SDR family oxidoreductase [Phenylobacterium sp.]|jgi:NAD(P)-dependent dehydrogenase (short-subunit alcohol dehydrogenase family)|uniref:SDR family oxidoreductase n=1 Tax=Phenylobacterium sp. TaxID=1871053 RepID=UPI002F42BEE3
MFSLDAFRLDGKVAIVTGAGARNNSIGEAYAKGLAAAGASVVVADLDAGGAERIAQEIISAGGQAKGVRADITDPASVGAMAALARTAFGGVDILVNNAALMVDVKWAPPTRTPIEQWNHIMAVNVTGALICAQAVAPMMRERGGGKIINQVSAGAFPANSVYGVSKLALVGLTTALAAELGRDNVNVNAIAPGMTASDAGSSMTPDESPLAKFLSGVCALRARGQPDELVGALLLLCSPAGAWITGQVLHIDGGWVVRP